METKKAIINLYNYFLYQIMIYIDLINLNCIDHVFLRSINFEYKKISKIYIILLHYYLLSTDYKIYYFLLLNLLEKKNSFKLFY